MKRMAFFLAAVIFPGILLMGQEEVWMEVPDVATGVSVEMPVLPRFESLTFFYDQEYITKEIFSCNAGQMDMVFQSQSLKDDSRKSISRAKSKAIDFMAIQLKGKPNKRQSLSRDGTDYSYVEMELASGLITRSILFAMEGKLFHLYVKGGSSEVFGLAANQFLGSWKAAEKRPADVVEAAGTEVEIDVRDPSVVQDGPENMEIDTWHTISVNDDIQLDFPGKPFRRKTVVEMDSRDIVVTAYSRYADAFNQNYVLTHREYGVDEGQLNNEDLYQYVIDQVVKHNRVKVNGSRSVTGSGFTGREYLLSKGIRFYRLQLFRLDNTMYQVMVKGKRKNINNGEVDRYFNSIKTLN